MVLFADSLVKKGVWKAHKSPLNVDYNAPAKTMFNTLRGQTVTRATTSPQAGVGVATTS